jgi:hypothetical protein
MEANARRAAEVPVPSVPVESGDTTSYRARLTSKLSVEFLLRHIDDVTQLVDAVLAVRDTELEYHLSGEFDE